MNQGRYKELLTKIRTIQNKAEREAAELYLNELRELKISVSDMYEQYGDDKGLVQRDSMMKYGRLQKLENELVDRIKALSNSQVSITKKAIQDTFLESYYYRGFVIETTAKLRVFSAIKKDVLDAIVFNDMLAIKWDETINNDNNHLIRQVKQTILSGLTQGASYGDMAKNLTKVVHIGRDKAVRIVQTETHRANEDGNLKSMQRAKEKGVVMKKRWLSTLGSRTRRTHQELDGQTIDVDDYFISSSGNKALAPCKFGVAAEDINCRCTTIAIFEGLEPTVRRARDESDKGEIISYVNYPEWRNNLK